MIILMSMDWDKGLLKNRYFLKIFYEDWIGNFWFKIGEIKKNPNFLVAD